MLLVQLSILSRVNGGIRFEVLSSDSVENIFHSISVSLACSGQKVTFLSFFAVNVFFPLGWVSHFSASFFGILG